MQFSILMTFNEWMWDLEPHKNIIALFKTTPLIVLSNCVSLSEVASFRLSSERAINKLVKRLQQSGNELTGH